MLGMMIPKEWRSDIDPTGMWMTEMPHGVPVLWDGQGFITEQGIGLHAPSWFEEHMPEDRIQGFLSAGRGNDERALGIVRRALANEVSWAAIRFNGLDLPDVRMGLEGRINGLLQTVAARRLIWVGNDDKSVLAPREMPFDYVRYVICQSREHLDLFHRGLRMVGGSGILLRRSGSSFIEGPSDDMLVRR